jgi:hypothetical protein
MTSLVVPALPGGALQVMLVSETRTTLLASAPEKVTRGVPAPSALKPVPVSVTRVPPAAGPWPGATPVSTGRMAS